MYQDSDNKVFNLILIAHFNTSAHVTTNVVAFLPKERLLWTTHQLKETQTFPSLNGLTKEAIPRRLMH